MRESKSIIFRIGCCSRNPKLIYWGFYDLAAVYQSEVVEIAVYRTVRMVAGEDGG
jgi:hypothetical protein